MTAPGPEPRTAGASGGAQTFIVDLVQASASACDEVGAKAQTLARLQRYGFNVPPGFVVFASLSQWVAAQPTVAEAIGDLPPPADRDPADVRLKERLKRVRTAIQATVLPVAFTEALGHALTAHGIDSADCAVRSSGVGEDGANRSFAGIHESFLEVRGRTAVIDAFKACLASAWSERAVAYRSHFGIADDAARMAVLVMEMVRPDAGGVLFTAGPRGGSRTDLMIAAARRASDVVAEASEAELWTLNATDITRIRCVRRPTRAGRPRILKRREALALAELGLAIERALHHDDRPMDIEWARRGTAFHVLQARPITTIDESWTLGGRSIPALWSNANLKDASPGVQSPLGADLMRIVLHAILTAPFLAAGYRAVETAPLAKVLHGRSYMNTAALQWAYYQAFHVSPRELSEGIGGFHEDLAVDEAASAGAGVRLRMARLFAASMLAYMGSLLFRRQRERSARLRARRNFAAMARRRLHRALGRELGALRRAGARFQLMNTLAGAGYGALRDELTRAGCDRADQLARRMLTGTGGVESVEYISSLQRMAERVRACLPEGADRARTAAMVDRLAATREDSEFNRAFDRLIARVGHRAVYEQEIANPRWSEDPGYLLRNVALICGDGDRARGDPAASYREAAREAMRGRSWPGRMKLTALLFLARQSARLRENSKSTMIRIAQPLRSLFIECGNRMASEGSIERSADVFLCSLPDVLAWLRAEVPARRLRELVADRADALGDLRRRAAPDVVGSRAAAPAPIQSEGRGVVLSGVGVSAGRAQGRARIIVHPGQCESLAYGEILIAPSSDPSWTPLFYRAAGLVLEMGGVLSHGAILARELGLPAVANVGQVGEWIKSGNMITVDGDLGRVFL